MLPESYNSLVDHRVRDCIRRHNDRERPRLLRNWKLFAGHHYNLDTEGFGPQGFPYDYDRYAKKGDFTRSNLTMAYVNIATAAVAGGEPDFIVRPLRLDCKDRAKFSTALINSIWRVIGATRECRRVRRDSYVYGYGILGISWVLETRNQRTEHYRRLGDQSQESRSLGIRKDDAEVFRISPFDFFFDPRADDPQLSDSRFIAWREHKPLSYLKRMDLDNPLDEADIYNIYQQQSADINPDDSSSLDDKTRVEVYHYWDADEGIYQMRRPGKQEPLLERENFYQFNPYKHPFPVEVLTYNEVPETVYPQSMCEQIEDEQLEYNLIFRHLSAYIRSKVPKLLTNKPDAIMPETEAALDSDEPMKIVKLYLSDAELKPMEFPDLPQEVWAYRAGLKQDMETMTGIGDYMSNRSPDRRETATVGKIRAVQGAVRLGWDASQYHNFLVRVGDRLLHLYQDPVFGDRKREVVVIAKDTGMREHLQGNHRDCDGEWAIEVVVGSTEMRDRDYQKELSALMIQTLAPFIESGEVNIAPILRKFLENWDILELDDILLDRDTNKALALLKQMNPEQREEIVAALSRAMQAVNQRRVQGRPQLAQLPPPQAIPQPPGADILGNVGQQGADQLQQAAQQYPVVV